MAASAPKTAAPSLAQRATAHAAAGGAAAAAQQNGPPAAMPAALPNAPAAVAFGLGVAPAPAVAAPAAPAAPANPPHAPWVFGAPAAGLAAANAGGGVGAPLGAGAPGLWGFPGPAAAAGGGGGGAGAGFNFNVNGQPSVAEKRAPTAQDAALSSRAEAVLRLADKLDAPLVVEVGAGVQAVVGGGWIVVVIWVLYAGRHTSWMRPWWHALPLQACASFPGTDELMLLTQLAMGAPACLPVCLPLAALKFRCATASW